MSNPSEILKDLDRLRTECSWLTDPGYKRALAAIDRIERALERRPSLEPSALSNAEKAANWKRWCDELEHPSGAQAGAVQRPAGDDRLFAWIEEAVEYVNTPTMSPSLEREGRDLLAGRKP